MAEPTEESKSKILLDPELNPILNPLLSAHMGRWAEVYFTSPPEKREQAVAELVRELARDSGAAAGKIGVIGDEKSGRSERQASQDHGGVMASASGRIKAGLKEQRPQPRAEQHLEQNLEQNPEDENRLTSPARHSAIEEVSITVCDICGHLNAPRQKFCGMCGVALAARSLQATASPSETELGSAEITEEEKYRWEPGSVQEQDRHLEADQFHSAESEPAPIMFPVDEAAAGQTASTDLPAAPRPHYRVYVGLGVIVVILFLVYATWRANAPGAGAQSDNPPPLLPGISSKLAKSPSSATPFFTGESSRPGNPAALQPKQTGEGQSRNADGGASTSNPAAAARTEPAVAGQNGGEELAVAQKYLKSNPDGARQAVGWLWKAVAKQNLSAMLILSDLYMNGEGVSKSCDQARLLLNAAARKGVRAASEKIRTLPSYGCQ